MNIMQGVDGIVMKGNCLTTGLPNPDSITLTRRKKARLGREVGDSIKIRRLQQRNGPGEKIYACMTGVSTMNGAE